MYRDVKTICLLPLAVEWQIRCIRYLTICAILSSKGVRAKKNFGDCVMSEEVV